MEELQEYADNCDDEYGEYLQSLINLMNYSYYMGNPIKEALIKEAEDCLEWCKNNSVWVVYPERIEEVKYPEEKVLEWQL